MGAPAKTVTRILVKMPNWVGDCVMATPALALIKTAIPHAEIHLLARPSVAGILQDNPHTSQVIIANDRDIPAHILNQIKSTDYAAITLLTNSLRSAWLARQLRIKRRIGFNREGRGLLLTHKLPYNPHEWQTPTPKPLSRKSIKPTTKPLPPGQPRHMVEYYLKLARATVEALNGDLNRAANMDFSMNLPLSRNAEEKVARLLRDAGIQGKTLIGINPGAAAGPAKRWPPQHLGRTIEILGRPDWAFISTASPAERHLNDAVQQVTEYPIHTLGEQVTLRELPALISRFSLLISNDSGPMHIAAARNVPTIAIFGPTDPPSTHPWQAPHTVIYKNVQCSPCFLGECPIDHRCMKNISNFEIAEAALNSLFHSSRWTPTTHD